MNGQILNKYQDLITGIVIAVFAIFYLIGSTYIKPSPHVSVGAEFMPKIYGSILLLLAVCLTYQGFLKAKQFSDKHEVRGEEEKDTKNAILSFTLIFAYVAFMEILGFVISSMIFLFIMSILLAPANTRHNYVTTVIYSILLPLSTYVLFKDVMHLSLPIGILFGK